MTIDMNGLEIFLRDLKEGILAIKKCKLSNLSENKPILTSCFIFLVKSQLPNQIPISKSFERINESTQSIFDNFSFDEIGKKIRPQVQRNGKHVDTALFDFETFANLCQVQSELLENKISADELLNNIALLASADISDNEVSTGLRNEMGCDATFAEYIIANRKYVSHLNFGGNRFMGNETSKNNALKGLMTKEQRNEALENTAKLQAEKAKDLKSAPLEERYPHVYGAPKGGNILNTFGQKYSLPPGSERIDLGNYEEIVIPAAVQLPIKEGERAVAIRDMDNLCAQCFPDYEVLNRMQSLVYPIAYYTNENMLVCAPTGAGKTDIALLTILHTISSLCSPSPSHTKKATHFYVNLSAMKIVYVAPMKALAAEIVVKLGKRLAPLSVKVRELTGDMQMTREEIAETQIIVTTPEKWDVVTRKGVSDSELVGKVKLLIIDEVHLLQDDRGAVIESLVARTLRQVESRQSMIRIVGLSATLPNFIDVSDFLRVNRHQGMFYFGEAFRPVPLERRIIGVRGKVGTKIYLDNLDKAVYDKAIDLLKDDRQVMIFVHSRKETVKAATKLLEMMKLEGEIDLIDPTELPEYDIAKQELRSVRNKELKSLFIQGIVIHHAGLARGDRNFSERAFRNGLARILVCTATLAWGVNLPAYCVIIKGTSVYDSQKGGFKDLGILDVQQIFGRAGRPGLETKGEGMICTAQESFNHYVASLTEQYPIESKLTAKLVDTLNAEISLGTVTNVDDGCQWLNYTYLLVRMRKNPLVYGLSLVEVLEDPTLAKRRRDLIVDAAKKLYSLKMITYDPRTQVFSSKELGRTSSDFYLRHSTIEVVNELMRQDMEFEDVLSLMGNCTEFKEMRVREDEFTVLEELANAAPYEISGDKHSTPAKVNMLLQHYVDGKEMEHGSLGMDTNFVVDNAQRISGALFNIALSRNWGATASMLLALRLAIENRMWPYAHPLSSPLFELPRDIKNKLNSQSWTTSLEEMQAMDEKSLGDLVKYNIRMGEKLSKCAHQLPLLNVEFDLFTLSRSILRVVMRFKPTFRWSQKLHAPSESFWIWIEDSNSSEILYYDYLTVSQLKMQQIQEVECTIPIQEPLPPEVYIRVLSNKWQGAESLKTVPFDLLTLPQKSSSFTTLLSLRPLPVSAFNDSILQEIYGSQFPFFNPIQTQVFHMMYHRQNNALLGAPTGSGKTMAAELAMWNVFREKPNGKVIYIAPLKALVRERVNDWNERLMIPIGKKLIELTGDHRGDSQEFSNADVVITTPEKWEVFSRYWTAHEYAQKVSLVILDEIHLMGGSRGSALEVVGSRLKQVISKTNNSSIRLLAISTAVSNSQDLAGWFNVKKSALYNFRNSVRPVPLEIHIEGFPNRGGYNARCFAMNKPAMTAVKTHSPEKPAIIFVSSRRQTRLTAQDLINFCAIEDNPRRFLHMPETNLNSILERVNDENLKRALSFGIGIHHASLSESDHRTVEELFVSNSIQVLVATYTVAWGMDLPAHLVIIKGTEFYDPQRQRYRDIETTDVLQMLGRACRPGIDNSGVAMIFTKDNKKSFYKHFLDAGFPVESNIHKDIAYCLRTEIVRGNIKNEDDAISFLSFTFFYKRLTQNPSYYGLVDASVEGVKSYLTKLVGKAFDEMVQFEFIKKDTTNGEVHPTSLGRNVPFYYSKTSA